MARNLGKLEDDDNEYLRYLAQWLKDNENNYLRYNQLLDADCIEVDLLYKEMVRFQRTLEKF